MPVVRLALEAVVSNHGEGPSQKATRITLATATSAAAPTRASPRSARARR